MNLMLKKQDIFSQGGLRAARNDKGKTYYVDGGMKYTDWHKVFVEKSMSYENWKKQQKNNITKLNKDSSDDILNNIIKTGENSVHLIGKINKQIYKCITDDIITDEVVITDVQIQHIKDRHPQDYERFKQYFPEIIQNPDYILAANKPNTAFILKTFNIKDENFQLILRIITSNDTIEYKNSIITFLKVSDKKWNKYLRNKKILYKKTKEDV